MTTTLTAEADIESLKERIGVGPDEELRTSRRREKFLEKFAKILSMVPGLSLQTKGDLAYVDMEDKEETPIVVVPTKEFDQPTTDYPRKIYDLIVQETLTLHEIGHVLYSDVPTVKEIREERVEEDYKQAFQLVWNAVEDGCIEKQLRSDFSCSNELAITNSNLAETSNFGKRYADREGSDEVAYSVVEAVVVAIMDYGHYNSGKLDKILDPDSPHHIPKESDLELFEEHLPVIRNGIAKAHSEPNGPKRNEIIYEFFQDIKELMEKADVSGKHNTGPVVLPIEGLSDDMVDAIGEAIQDMDGLPDESEISMVIHDPEGKMADKVPENARPVQTPPKTEAEMKQKNQKELKSEVEALDGGESLIDELQKFQQAMASGGPGVRNQELIIPDFETGRRDIWREAEILSKRLERILRNRLNAYYTREWRRRLRRGKVDTKAMIRAANGDPRVFKRERNEEERDYSCILVQDRSGSMSSNTDEAEISVAAFVIALEQLGVDTSVIDFLGGQTRLAKPFGSKPTDTSGTLTSGDCGGGTPLTDAMQLARERIRIGAGTHPFVIVITDGKAHKRGEYKKEIDKATFPVMAIYLRSDLNKDQGVFNSSAVGDELADFHSVGVATRGDDIGMILQEMASGVMV